MCLAIAQRAGATIPRAHLIAGADSNRSGAGLAYISKGKVVIDKGYMDGEIFADLYERLRREHPKSPFLVHFRTATSGKLGKDNCHPFRGKYGAFIHNGVFTWGGDGDKSDTSVLAGKIFNMPARAVPLFAKRICDVVGYNKLVFLTNDGKIHIAGESNGHWVDDIWYSNSCYKRGNYDRGGVSSRSPIVTPQQEDSYGDDEDWLTHFNQRYPHPFLD